MHKVVAVLRNEPFEELVKVGSRGTVRVFVDDE
jgi:hypothetical protein